MSSQMNSQGLTKTHWSTSHWKSSGFSLSEPYRAFWARLLASAHCVESSTESPWLSALMYSERVRHWTPSSVTDTRPPSALHFFSSASSAMTKELNSSSSSMMRVTLLSSAAVNMILKSLVSVAFP